MKKALFIVIFSLLTLAPLRFVVARAINSSPQVRELKTSAPDATKNSAGHARNSPDPIPQTAAANSTATNASASRKAAESPEEISDNASGGPGAAAQKTYDAGMALYDSGKLDEAIGAFKQANKLRPDDPQTQYMLGMVYWKAKAYKDAADSFKRAVRLKPDWSEAHFNLGTMFYILGKASQSLEEYKKLVELKSPLAKALYRIVKQDIETADVSESRGATSKASSSKAVEVVPLSTSTRESSEPSSSKAIEVVPLATSTRETTGGSSTKAGEMFPPSTSPKKTSDSAPADANGSTSKTEKAAIAPTAASPRAEDNHPTSVLNSSAGDAAEATLTGTYRIGVGDVLDIRLLNSFTPRSTLFTVVEGGLIDFPIAGGAVSVAGLTVAEVQARIASELKRRAVEEGAQVSVGVRQYASHTIFITGLVNNPGTKILRREAVPLYVILAEAQPRQDAGRVSIMRGTAGQFFNLGDSDALNFTLRPGDVVNITARPQEFYYIAGRINYPGQKIFQPGITLLQAILAAGGVVRQSDNEIELSREGDEGRLATTKFNLKEIKAGKIQDPRLQPGDRIEVVH